MKKVLYFINYNPDWIDVAQYLLKQKEWIPTFWQVYVPKHTKKIISMFGNEQKIFENRKARQIGLSDNTVSQSNGKSLYYNIDDSYYKLFKDNYVVLNRLVDRTNKFILSYQREDFLLRQFNHWIDFVTTNDFDILFMPESPHDYVNFMIYIIFEHLNKQIIMFGQTAIKDLIFLKKNITDVPRTIRSEVLETTHNISLMNYFHKLSDANYYSDLEPDYDYQQLAQNNKKELILRNIFQPSFYLRYFFRLYHLIRLYHLNKVDFASKYYSYIYQKNFRIRLKKEYSRCVTKNNIDLKSIKYIYFPLHYQPEKTTIPEGGDFFNQIHVLSYLRSVIPMEILIIVKEHPAQFNNTQSYISRDLDYYRRLNRINNLHLIDTQYSPLDLIDNSIAVSTITGTVGIEALARKKPVFVFGYPWYRNLPNVFPHKDYKKDVSTFEVLINSYEFKNISEEIRELSNNLIHGNMHFSHNIKKSSSETLNLNGFINNILNALENY